MTTFLQKRFKVGALFGCSGEVLLVGSYISNDPTICTAYEQRLQKSQLAAVTDYIYKHRCLEGREVLFIGDFNAYMDGTGRVRCLFWDVT